MRPSATLEYTPKGDALKFSFDYDQAMVAALKSTIPSSGRRFDWDSKVWLVAPQYEDQCRKLALRFLNVNLGRAQRTFFDTPDTVTELIELRYLGSTKDRGGDVRTASGHDGQTWRFIFPESVLKNWFGIIDNDPTSENTLYAVLGIGRSSPGSDIKRAFKSAARQWHPDVCNEPNATQVFQRINEAYQILSNPKMRARYDAGLALEASMDRPKTDLFESSWRAPLRCGYLLVTATMQLGRLLVSDIHQWTEIVKGGKTLVTSWRYGDDTYTERWV